MRKIIDFMHMLNLIYISVALPFTIAFHKSLDHSLAYAIFEGVSIFI